MRRFINLFQACIQFRNARNRTPKCHTGSPLHHSSYIADIMSAPRTSTVWVTPASTSRGLKVATMDGPVEAGRLPVAGVRWHEPRDVDSRLRSRAVRLLAGMFSEISLGFLILRSLGNLHWTNSYPEHWQWLLVVVGWLQYYCYRIPVGVRTLWFMLLVSQKNNANNFRIRRPHTPVAKS
jgi:hypothetical protein